MSDQRSLIPNCVVDTVTEQHSLLFNSCMCHTVTLETHAVGLMIWLSYLFPSHVFVMSISYFIYSQQNETPEHSISTVTSSLFSCRSKHFFAPCCHPGCLPAWGRVHCIASPPIGQWRWGGARAKSCQTDLSRPSEWSPNRTSFYWRRQAASVRVCYRCWWLGLHGSDQSDDHVSACTCTHSQHRYRHPRQRHSHRYSNPKDIWLLSETLSLLIFPMVTQR